MHYLNSKTSYIIFWSIMLAISGLGFAIALYFKSKGLSSDFSTNNIAATIIFGAISSMVTYNETFKYTLNMGCTRKNFVLGFVVYNILLALTLSIIFNILMINEFLIYKAIGFNASVFGYNIGSLIIKQIWSNILFQAAVILAFAALSGLIGSIYYLKGMMYIFGIGAAVIVLFFFPGVRAASFDALMFIYNSFTGIIGPFALILYALLFSLVCYILIYGIARVSQVKR